jgi:hypothetical protein
MSRARIWEEREDEVGTRHYGASVPSGNHADSLLFGACVRGSIGFVSVTAAKAAEGLAGSGCLGTVVPSVGLGGSAAVAGAGESTSMGVTGVAASRISTSPDSLRVSSGRPGSGEARPTASCRSPSRSSGDASGFASSGSWGLAMPASRSSSASSSPATSSSSSSSSCTGVGVEDEPPTVEGPARGSRVARSCPDLRRDEEPEDER